MASKRKSRQGPSNLPTKPATQLSLLPEDSEARNKIGRSARLPDGTEDSRSPERKAYLEQKELERLLKRMGYTADEWELRRRHYLEKPLDDAELRSESWKIEKLKHSRLAVEVALERQKKPSPAL